MDDVEIKRRIDKYLMEICHYSQMQVFATSDYQKRYLQYQIDWVANELFDLYLVSHDTAIQPQQILSTSGLLQQYVQQTQPEQQPVQQQPQQTQPEQQPVQQPQQTQPEQPPTQQQPQQTQRVITTQELAQNNGREGKPAYVAVNGNVYDVSTLNKWAGGAHFGLNAGKDLTNEFMGCHNGVLERLQKVPIVGVLIKE